MLINQLDLNIRFSDLDPMGIVWHGNYIKYFEDGREAFGKEYNIGYSEAYSQGFYLPLTHIECQFKKPIQYNDELVLETKYINQAAAKITFEYTILSKNDKSIVAVGKSEQVFLTMDRQLHLTIPDFYTDWKKKWSLK